MRSYRIVLEYKENMMQELEKVMNEFVNVSRERHDGYAYATGYMMSVIQILAVENPTIAERLTKQFTISLEGYK